MKTVPAMLRLTDFSAEAAECAPQPSIAIPPTEIVEFPQTPEPRDLQKEIDQASSQVLAEAEARHEAQVQQILQDHGQQLELERSRATDQQAELLMAKLGEEFVAFGQDMAGKLFEKCRPVLGTLARDQAVGELAEVLNTVVRENSKVRFTGPAELLQALREQLADQDLNAEWQEDPVADISVKVGDTIVETQLSEWFSSLVEAVDG